jgi:transposase
MNAQRTRPAYPSDLSERQWRKIEPLLSPALRRGRPRTTDLREVVNAISYRWTTGCVWRMLPHDLPPWETVYTYFRKWQRDGTLREMRARLLPGRFRESKRKGPPLSNRRLPRRSLSEPRVDVGHAAAS